MHKTKEKLVHTLAMSFSCMFDCYTQQSYSCQNILQPATVKASANICQ